MNEERQKGILYVCATPIGNLEDMTYRAVRILEEADLIAAEDTRNSIRLLNHFEIHTPMTSYHEHNKYDKARELVEKLMAGISVALITDAGTPGISDPGEVLVAMCIEQGIRVVPVPGACAFVNALAVSGQHTARFVFEGFLPRDKKEKRGRLAAMEQETRTIILHEAPHHLRETLSLLGETLGDRQLSLCRELTKIHEEVTKTTIFEAINYYKDNEPLGEFVLVIAGRDEAELEEARREALSEIPVQERVAMYEQQGYPKKEAMRMAAKEYGISRRDVYQSLL